MKERDKVTILNKWLGFSKNENSATEGALKGEIYELYCYDKIIEKYNNVGILYAKCTENLLIGSNHNGFYYNNIGQLIYQSNDIDLGEFDVIGISDTNKIFWWEITINNKTTSAVKKRIERKKELLHKIFPKNKICFHLVLPEKSNSYQEYPLIEIKEPNYEKLFKSVYEFKSDLNHCIELSCFTKFAVQYDYIQDVIKKSKKYFKFENTQYNSNLLERLYDINHINDDCFKYFNIEKQKTGIIKMKNGEMEKDGEKVEKRKAAYKEVVKIRDYFNHVQS